MGLMDKAKSAAGQATAMAKAGADQAAAKAHELQVKRDLDKAYADLGKKTYELGDNGNSDLAADFEKIAALLADLETSATDSGEDDS
jgi:hypothetical protein